VMAEPGPGLDRTVEIGRALATIATNLVVVGSAADQLDGAHASIAIHRLPEVLAPIANVVPLQWVAYLASVERGVNADAFREDEPAYAHAIKSLQL